MQNYILSVIYANYNIGNDVPERCLWYAKTSIAHDSDSCIALQEGVLRHCAQKKVRSCKYPGLSVPIPCFPQRQTVETCL